MMLMTTSESLQTSSSSTSTSNTSSGNNNNSNSSNCLVCGDSALTRHFGSLCCNACAAFFRRSVAGKRTYSCMKQGNCTIVYGSPKRLCRHCRYIKCLEAGMKESEVQSCNNNSSNNSNSNFQQPSPPPTSSKITEPSKATVSSLLIALDKILSAHFSAKIFNNSLIDFQTNIPLSPETFEQWNQQQKEKMEIYLSKMGIIIPTLQHSTCYQQITSLWITMAMTQSTIEKNGHNERKIKFDNGTFLEISVNGIKDAFGLNFDGIGDGFLLGSLLKAFSNIYDLCCLSVQCNLTFVDLVFALHLAILSTVLRSMQQLPESQILNDQLTSLESEMEIFYKNSGEKLTALRFITNQLSQFTVDFEIISQALKLKLQKDLF